MKSYSNILLAVRRVTQTNQGKRTAGIDKILVKTPEAREILTDTKSEIYPLETITHPPGIYTQKEREKTPLRNPYYS